MRLRRLLPLTLCLLAACVTSSASRGMHPSTAPTPEPATSAPTSTCTNASAVATWSLQRKSSFLLVAPVLNFDMTTVRVAAKSGAGGVLFLGSAPPPAGLGAQLRASLADGAGLPPIAMADEEGGGIQRLAGPVVSMPYPRTMASTMSPSQVEALTAEAGSQMRALDVDMDLAPVADLDAGPGPSATNPDGQRSFSADPTVASKYTVAYAAGLSRSGVIPVVKHFPGLGGATGNTDYGPASTPPLSTLQTRGLVPFKSAIGAGDPAIMVSNAAVPGLTALPASLSSSVITGLLRSQLGFNGLVLTDSVSAGAITAAGYDVPKAVASAIGAGADMVLFGSTLTAQQVALLTPSNVASTLQQASAAIVSAVNAGAVPIARIDAAVQHILTAEHINLCAG